MTVELRRLVALAAVLAPDRAARLLSRLAAPWDAVAATAAAALARAGREERLSALAACLRRPEASRAAHPLVRRLARERPAPARWFG